MRSLVSLMFLCSLLWACSSEPNTNASPEEAKIEELLQSMTLEEKIGQLNQRGTSSRERGLSDALRQAVREGRVGSMLNVTNEDHVRELQRIAVEESPNGIPLIFARDVIHGYKTIFPIPLGQSAAWNPDLIELGAEIAAREATAHGIRWTFAPMLDIARDPRWGRIAESPGEDPYLAELFARASVRGFQGDDLSDRTRMLACSKHFVGYGAAIGGRDYNTALLSEEQLENVYFPPFKASVEEGAGTFMTSFNELNGIPASGNKYLLDEVLRKNWGFDGFVVSDWESIIEMIAHGYSEDEKAAAESAINAGLDMEMTSAAYEFNLQDLVAEGKVTEAQIDERVRGILRIKFRMGLFDNPGFDGIPVTDYAPEHLEAAQKAAAESMVLLKNEESVLPISPAQQRIALIGPLAHAPREQLGTWTFDGDSAYAQTPLEAFREQFGGQVNYSPGLTHSRDKTKAGFNDALAAARRSDVVVFVGGEEAILSGEAHSRANIDLPGEQETLIQELAKLGKPIVLVIMAGRPITVGNILDEVDAVLMAWHPGTMAGPALAEILSGAVNPSGRLPVTWPKSVGQIPFFYNHKNTGRPAVPEDYVSIDNIPIGAWQSSLGNDSHYLDDGYTPLYPFGYGLSYSEVAYGTPSLDKSTYAAKDKITVQVELSHQAGPAVTEVVQVYVRDHFGSVTRPVAELKAFEKVDLASGATQTVTLEIPVSRLAFWSPKAGWGVEPGKFSLWVGANCVPTEVVEFTVE